MFGRCWAGGSIRGTVESVLPLGAATLLRLVGRLCALRYDGQGRRKDAAGETVTLHLPSTATDLLRPIPIA
eukprot:scaffold24193_cov104-Amphora_coffeaeformis.AAC.1